MKNLIVIGGTMGAGKTTVCRQLQKLLPDNVFLDGDWCWDMQPFAVTEENKRMVLDNIVFLLRSFLHNTSFQNILFCWVLQEDAVWESIAARRPTAGVKVHRITLTVSEQALRDRLYRDVAAGLRLPDVIERSVARLPLYDRVQSAKLDVSTCTAAEAAQQIAKIVEEE